jgi:hypothetical protein
MRFRDVLAFWVIRNGDILFHLVTSQAGRETLTEIGAGGRCSSSVPETSNSFLQYGNSYPCRLTPPFPVPVNFYANGPKWLAIPQLLANVAPRRTMNPPPYLVPPTEEKHKDPSSSSLSLSRPSFPTTISLSLHALHPSISWISSYPRL